MSGRLQMQRIAYSARAGRHYDLAFAEPFAGPPWP